MRSNQYDNTGAGMEDRIGELRNQIDLLRGRISRVWTCLAIVVTICICVFVYMTRVQVPRIIANELVSDGTAGAIEKLKEVSIAAEYMKSDIERLLDTDNAGFPEVLLKREWEKFVLSELAEWTPGGPVVFRTRHIGRNTSFAFFVAFEEPSDEGLSVVNVDHEGVIVLTVGNEALVLRDGIDGDIQLDWKSGGEIVDGDFVVFRSTEFGFRVWSKN